MILRLFLKKLSKLPVVITRIITIFRSSLLYLVASRDSPEVWETVQENEENFLKSFPLILQLILVLLKNLCQT